jgi:hypothetical protein
LPVKVRYLAEFMASDDTSKLTSLNVPLLALRPGFDEKFLADPANSWYKTSFQDSWDAFAKTSRIQLLTIPNARALILDDQPKLTDVAIARFVEHVDKSPEGSRLLEPENLRMGISDGSRYRQPEETDGTFPFLEIMVALTLLLIAEGT